MSDAEGPDWASVRSAYVDKRLTIAEICTKFGITLSRLYRRHRSENWPLRREQSPSARRLAARGQGRAGDLIGRLFDALERQMRDIEHRMNGGQPGRVPADRARDARTLASLVATLEKLFELDRVRGAGSGSRGTDSDVARLRQALARRIVRLGAQREPGDG
jgi:hypothetical protein